MWNYFYTAVDRGFISIELRGSFVSPARRKGMARPEPSDQKSGIQIRSDQPKISAARSIIDALDFKTLRPILMRQIRIGRPRFHLPEPVSRFDHDRPIKNQRP
jgi:hypothetical protein